MAEISASILFSDIKGSSALSENQAIKFKREIEPELLKKVVVALKPVNELMNPLDGPVLHYNTWGDAYLFILRSPNDALKASLALKDAFARFDFRNENFPEDIDIRCSLHAGVIEIDDFEDPIRGGYTREIVGKNVVVSARIEPITPPGRIWATQAFKDQLHNTPSGIELDPLGVKNFSKRWGAQILYDVRHSNHDRYHGSNTLLHDNFNEKFLPIKISKNNGLFRIEKNGPPMHCQRRMMLEEWSNKVHELEELFFSNSENKSIDGIGIAIGIQNFLYDGSSIYAGVRTKAMSDAWGTGFTLGKGAFNTGYRALRDDAAFDQIVNHDFQDLFNLLPTAGVTKTFVKDGSDISLMIKQKAGRRAGIVELNGNKYVALFFINTSRILPRIEIGICKYMDISSAGFDEYLSSFGKDKFAEKSEEGNFWLWINDGIIFARSIANENYIPCISEREKLANMNCILIKNDIEKYGFVERYVPLVSDEVLTNESELLSTQPFSSPARALLELF